MNIIDFQLKLKNADCYKGAIDGVWGQMTMNAYIKWCEKNRFEIPTYLYQAFKDLGIKEIAGSGIHPRIAEYHKNTSLKATTDEVAWCSSGMNTWMKEGGHKFTNNAMARSWLGYGDEILKPCVGAIAVLKRGEPPQGHVGFFLFYDHADHSILLFGGNQSNAVSVQRFSAHDVISYRKP